MSIQYPYPYFIGLLLVLSISLSACQVSEQEKLERKLTDKNRQISELEEELAMQKAEIEKLHSVIAAYESVAENQPLAESHAYRSEYYKNGVLTESYDDIEEELRACKQKVDDLESQLNDCE